MSQSGTIIPHADGVFSELKSGEDFRQLGELTEDVRVRRHVLNIEGYPKPTENHEVCHQGDDVTQRLLTVFYKDRFGDGASPLCWLVEHLFQLDVCRQVLEEIELVAIVRRCEESQDGKTKGNDVSKTNEKSKSK